MNRLPWWVALVLVAGLLVFHNTDTDTRNRLLWGIKLPWLHSLLYRLTGRVLVAKVDLVTGRRLDLYWDDGDKFMAGGDL